MLSFAGKKHVYRDVLLKFDDLGQGLVSSFLFRGLGCCWNGSHGKHCLHAVGDIMIYDCYWNIPLTISTTKRVNTCLIPSPVSWRIQAKKMDPCTSFCISLHPSLGRWHLHAWVSGGNHCRASWVPGSGMGSRGALSIASMLLRRGDELPAIVSLLLWKLGYSIVWFWSMYIYILCNILSGRIMVDIQLRHPSSRIAKTL